VAIVRAVLDTAELKKVCRQSAVISILWIEALFLVLVHDAAASSTSSTRSFVGWWARRRRRRKTGQFVVLSLCICRMYYQCRKIVDQQSRVRVMVEVLVGSSWWGREEGRQHGDINLLSPPL
jgi:hypothetical protein